MYPYIINEDGTVEKYHPDKITAHIKSDGPTGSHPPSRERARCPVCQIMVRANRLDRHLRKVHGQEINNSATTLTASTKQPDTSSPKEAQPSPASRELVPCPHCQVQVRTDRLQRHLRKVHRSKVKKKLAPQRIPKMGQIALSDRQGLASETLYQSFYETRDGSKGLGHMRRDFDGAFGSYPLHDDFDDESSAD